MNTLPNHHSVHLRYADIFSMSSPSKYSGLAGTVLLGTLLGLNYTQYARRKSPLSEKGGSFDPASEDLPGALQDKSGNHVPLGTTNLPGVSFVHGLRDAIPKVSPLFICFSLTGLWAVRAIGSMNRVLVRRYSDVVYQIRRPDVIRERLIAWKYLGVGGIILPVSAALYIAGTGSKPAIPYQSRAAFSMLVDDSLRIGSVSALNVKRGAFSESVNEFSRTLRAGFKP